MDVKPILLFVGSLLSANENWYYLRAAEIRHIEIAMSDDRPLFFDFRSEIEVYAASVVETLGRMQDKFVHERLPAENTQRYLHGRSWSHRANPEVQSFPPVAHTATIEVSFEEIIAGNYDALPRTLKGVTAELQKQFMQTLYSTVSQVCDANGNVISQKEAGSFANAFLEMLRKIEFGVDRDGKVSLPELHVGVDPSKLVAELESQSPEFKAEIERIQREKASAALEREAARKARFKSRTK